MQSGDLAPPIQLSAIDGKVFDSRSLAGRRYLVTLFRFASCPFCNWRMAELVRRRDELGEDFEIIAIFEADLGHLQKHASQHLAVFPVLADPKRASYREYGIRKSLFGVIRGIVTRINVIAMGMLRGYVPREISSRLLTMPASFLVDEQGIIRLAYYGRDEGDHLSFDSIKSFAQMSRRSPGVLQYQLDRG